MYAHTTQSNARSLNSPVTRRFAVVAMLATAFFTAGVAKANEAVYYKVLKSAAWVVVPKGPAGNTFSRVSLGSGVVVDAGRRWVVTNYHVVGESDQAMVVFPVYNKGEVVSERRYYERNLRSIAIKGRVIARARSKDLAMIELERLPAEIKAITLAPRSARAAQTAHAVANQGGTEALWTYTYGKVRQVVRQSYNILVEGKRTVIDCRVMINDLALNPGDSGGPIVNDKSELVALVSAGKPKSRLVSMCIDVTEIRSFIQEAKSPKVVRSSPAPSQVPDQAKIIADLIRGDNPAPQPQPEPRIQPRAQFSIVGMWSANARFSRGGSGRFALALLSNGRFGMAADFDNGKKLDTNGTWKLANGRLTLIRDGRNWITGRVVWTNASQFTLDDGTDRTVFVKSSVGVKPGANVNPTPQPIRLEGTTWSGKEQLAQYGNLSFRFLPGGKATMIDAQQTVEGTFTVKGDQVTLSFPRVRATYRGRISGGVLTGTGQGQTGSAWNFTVRLQRGS